jgi:hypothetical protein
MMGDGGDDPSIDHSAPISFISSYPHIPFPYTVPCSDLLVAAMSRCALRGEKKILGTSRVGNRRRLLALTHG